MKNYIKNNLLSILEVNEEQIKIEIPPKDNMGDYSIQCANLRNDKMNNPIDIANFIKDNFNDNENKFSNIKVMGPYVNFYIDYDKFNRLLGAMAFIQFNNYRQYNKEDLTLYFSQHGVFDEMLDLLLKNGRAKYSPYTVKFKEDK